MPLAMLAKKDEQVTLLTLIDSVKANVKGRNCGAIVTFTGVIRPKTAEGETVDHLAYEVFEEAARKALDDLVKGLLMLEGVFDAAICHKYGRFLPGEEVVYIAIAAERSEAAFNALRLAVNRTKHEIPIWKKEFTGKSGYWVDLE